MTTIEEYREKVKDYKNLIVENKKKHYSKNYKGFLKMVERHDKKPEIKKVKLMPEVLTYDFEEGCYIPIEIQHYNKKWNGINLKCLKQREDNQTKNIFGEYGSKFCLSNNGKICLSRKGKNVLEKKKNNEKNKIYTTHRETKRHANDGYDDDQ